MAYAGAYSARAPKTGAKARDGGSVWHEPQTWTVALLLATGVVVIARHPLAHALGTESDITAASTSVSSVPSQALAAVPTHRAPSLAAVPTHAPRDPFRTLLKSSGDQSQVLSGTATVGSGTVTSTPGLGTGTVSSSPGLGSGTDATTPAQPKAPAPGAAAGSCTGTMHTVVPGDSLWSIAARAVKSGDTGRIVVAWHRLYAANRPPLGADPSLVPVGAQLCVPDSL